MRVDQRTRDVFCPNENYLSRLQIRKNYEECRLEERFSFIYYDCLHAVEERRC